jgi:hypothetical protein
MDEREHTEIASGSNAADLLSHPAFQAARAQILEGIAQRRRTVPIQDTAMHTRLILLEQCWGAIEAYLEQARQTGEMTKFQVAETEKRRGVLDFLPRSLRA